MKTKPLFYLLILFFCMHYSAFAQVTIPIPKINKIETELVKLTQDSELKNASLGFCVYDLTNNKAVIEYNQNMSLVPASVQKLLTTAAGLETMGRNFRFKTEILYSGEIDSGRVLHGNIYIKGWGDPTLGSEFYKNMYYNPWFMDVWADTIHSFGIDSVDGNIIGDPSFYGNNMIPSTWIWGDIANYYGACAYGLSIYDNIYSISFKSGTTHGDPTEIVKIEPLLPPMDFDNHVFSSDENKDNAYIYGAPFSDYRYIEGSIPKNRSEFIVKGSIPDPPHVAALELEKAMRAKGIGISGSATTTRLFEQEKDTAARTMICTNYSPSLQSIVQLTNMHSINLYAESVLHYLGYLKFGSGDNNSGTAAVETFWKEKGIDTDGLYMNDGSGLSRYNAVTTGQLVAVLKYMKKSSNFSAFENSFPVAGKSGTVSSMCRGTSAEGRVMAKSGSMTRVRSYAGYVTTTGKTELAFAVIVNNFNCNSNDIRKKLEKLFIAMAEYSVQ